MGIILLVVSAMSYLMSRSQAIGDGDFRSHDILACEDYTINLRCPGNDIINVQLAAYGRRDDMTCVVDQNEMQDMHCELPNAKEVVAKLCNGNTTCSFMVGSKIFQDPCPGTKKYLNVKYECVPFIISCPGKLHSVSFPSRTRTELSENAAWMKDPYQVSDRLYYMGYTEFRTKRLFEYESLESMNGGTPTNFYSLPQVVAGTGFVVYDRSIFYTPEGTREVKRYDLSTQTVEATVTLPQAHYGGISPYAIELATDIDLAVDENGLWAIYATEHNEGKIVISRLKHHSLEILNTWTTDYDKLSALNTFMVCGVLYMVNFNTMKIDHMYNTTSNIGTNINIDIRGLSNTTSAIKYNPKEQKLYVWDRKMAMKFTLNFTPFVNPSCDTSPIPSTTTPITTSSTITTATTTTPPFASSTIRPGVVPLCPAVESGGMMWPASKYDEIQKHPCPAPSLGNAIWLCGGNVTHPAWEGDAPDFSQCTSEWIRLVQRKLDEGIDSAASISNEFQRELKVVVYSGRKMSTWDIVKSVELQRAILDKATSGREDAANLMGSMLKTASLLMERSLQSSWESLPRTMQNNISSELIRVVEDAAFFLAYDMSIAVSKSDDASPQKKLNWPEKFVSIEIRVDSIPESTQDTSDQYRDNIVWQAGQGNVVKLDTKAVFSAVKDYASGVNSEGTVNLTITKNLAVVMLSFHSLGQYMKDDTLYSTYRQPVGSRVISASAASITRTSAFDASRRNNERELSVIVNRLQAMDLKEPLQITFIHTKQGLHYHACAFWDYKDRTTLGRWWRAGCRAAEVNSTHSVCECDHMTSFAVLSSNVPLPSLGADDTPPGPTMAPQIMQRDLPILRTGLCISLLFLVLVAATLLPLSASRRLHSDINTIHKNLIISLIVTEVVFLCGIDRNLVPEVCGVIAGLLHLGLLATFTWAALEAYHLMVVLGDVSDRQDRWRWYYAIGYGAPIVVVAVSAAADHTGYGTGDVCWLKTDGSFIWSFIGPCCFDILCCMAFISITMYRLHLYSITFSDSQRHKTVRSGVTRSCLLMFLLCALWSCGVLWLSNFQTRVMAVLFCILSSLYGIAAFFLHCILPSEVRNYYSSCFSRIAKRSRQGSDHFNRHHHLSNGSHHNRHSSATSHSGTGRLDHTSSYGGFYTTRTGCTTTLLPVSAAQSASLGVDHGRCASDMDITRMNRIDNSQFSMHRGAGSAVDLTNEVDQRDPLIHHTHPGHGDAVHWPERRYEQPLPQIPNCSTIASSASGHYNHLHEHYSSGSHHHLVPSARCNHQRFNHHYETMDLPLCKECPGEVGVQLQMGENGEPRAVHYRHCIDESQQHRTVALTAPLKRNRGSFSCCEQGCENVPATMHHGLDMDQIRQSYPGHDHAAVNRMYLTHSSHHPNAFTSRQIKMGTSDLQQVYKPEYGPAQRRSKHGSYQGNRTGRSSDPLSTDQGYDTDNQQHGCRACCDSQSDNDLSCSPRPPSLPKQSLVVRSLDNGALPTIAAASDLEIERNGLIAPIPIKRVPKQSVSEESLCSENDKEVQRIISSNREKPNTSSSNGFQNHKIHQNGVSHLDDVIDTARGGRLSLAESVTSWCAHAGSNPRAVNSSYGKNNKGKNKKTADPSIIIANAKMRADNGDTPPQGRSKTYVYTLPGTAATGTKAKIDLKNGGISMITNL